MIMYKKRDGETIVSYKERLFRNRTSYNLSWEQVTELIDKKQHHDHTRKLSYGYLEALDDIKNVEQFDKSVMVINDIHLPYERSDVLEIISKHANEITTLVIAGDLMDCHSISSFPKIEDSTLEDEIIYAHGFMKEIRKILNNNQKIILIKGNHEARLAKNICQMQQKNLQKFINPNILDMLVDGFTIYTKGKKKKYEGIQGLVYIDHWYVNIDNKIIVCHPMDFSRAKGAMLEKTASHFINKDVEFDVLVFGHTHKYSTGLVDRFMNKFVIENPCLCEPHSYSDCGKLGYSPQTYGYTIIKYNNDEKINFNDIKTYLLDEITNITNEYKIEL